MWERRERREGEQERGREGGSEREIMYHGRYYCIYSMLSDAKHFISAENTLNGQNLPFNFKSRFNARYMYRYIHRVVHMYVCIH